MNEKLAELYGTNTTETDVEKLAAAELAEKLAADDSLDLDSMSAEQIEALAAEVLEEAAAPEAEKTAAEGDEEEAQEEGAEGEEEAAEGEEEAAEESEEEKTEDTEEEPAEEKKDEPAKDEGAEKTAAEKEAMAKIAEADFLGRVMAHAYVKELKEIEKKASGFPFQKEEKKDGKKEEKKDEKKGDEKEKKASKGGKVGAFLAKGMKKKANAEVSALDTLALARAQEILKANGIEVEQPAAEAPAAESKETEKVANDKYEMLDQAVTKRAEEMLIEAGYKFEE